MSILTEIRDRLLDIENETGEKPLVVRLCLVHNQEAALVLYKDSIRKKNYVFTVFNRPVVAEEVNGKLRCIVCEAKESI